jgi:hypothetical protein
MSDAWSWRYPILTGAREFSRIRITGGKAVRLYQVLMDLLAAQSVPKLLLDDRLKRLTEALGAGDRVGGWF